jgi:hypothetical protein
MPNALPDKKTVLDAIRSAALALGRPPSRSEFKSKSGMTEYQVLRHFPSWREALRASGFEASPTNVRLDDCTLLEDWGHLVRTNRHIPTRDQYRRDGKFSPGSFEKHFGPWSAIPDAFRSFANGKSEWLDVLALLPVNSPRFNPSPALVGRPGEASEVPALPSPTVTQAQHSKLHGRATYGNPIDFRGLRHEPVNENGVVFLFGIVARELGYLVEAVQAGFPDCEAKRQVAVGRWQRVRIEFEFESRNFRDHGHPIDGCDVIVCWRHNWTDCPPGLEVVELSSVIKSLAKTED